jgi:hypothetical protein
MKFRITMKDPDSPYEYIRDAARDSIMNSEHLSNEEIEMIMESRTDNYIKFIKPWIKYGEYITLEFDTVENTCKIIENI